MSVAKNMNPQVQLMEESHVKDHRVEETISQGKVHVKHALIIINQTVKEQDVRRLRVIKKARANNILLMNKEYVPNAVNTKLLMEL